ncbi:MAG: OmpA family protein [Sandaracinaceae bacterium]|nr:OmpA family protein [Sandaracinaceae bacterium]
MRLDRIVALALTALAGACGGPVYPNCNNDSNCHEGELCVNGRCQQCRSDGDCPAGQQCAGGRCEPIEGYCSSSSDCPAGQECRNNRCAPAMSTSETPEAGPGACSLSPVYFAFDSSELDGATRSTLQSNATCIQQRDIPRVRLTGHCDPRGTEEYNLALGERRAQGVQQFVERLGVDRSRMTAASMGEEMARGTDESSWAQDRRVDFEER